MTRVEKPLGGRWLAYLVAMAWWSIVGGAQTPNPPQEAISGVIAAGTTVELVKEGFKGTLEGPVGTPDGGLYFCDIPANRIYRLDPHGAISVWRENMNEPKALFLMKDGRLLVAEGSGKRVTAVMPDGNIKVLATGFLRPNDLIPDKKGGIYLTDTSLPGKEVLGLEALYYLPPTGERVLLDNTMLRPNGLTLSLDEKTLYVIDGNSEYAIYAYDVQPDGGVKNKHPFVKLRETQKTPTGWRSGADGMALDSQGRIYVTSNTGVQVISPHGEYLGTIRLPVSMRNLAFGGPRRQTLYLVGTALYRVELLSEGPAGRAK